MKRLFLLGILAIAGYYFGHTSRPHYGIAAVAANPIHRVAFDAPAYTPNAVTTANNSAPRLVDNGAIDAAIASAKSSVLVSAYTLSPQSHIVGELERAQQRGVHVMLVLTGDGMGYAVEQNRRFAAEHPDMHIQMLSRPIHLKTVVVDHGAHVFVTDRNFAGEHDLVLALPSSYAITLERAAVGDPHDAPPLTVTKGTSLDEEAALINTAQRTLSIETESFGQGNPVSEAIVQAVNRGIHVHLVVARNEYSTHVTEQRFIDQLRAHGVAVDLSDNDQKIAVVDSAGGFLGSANATASLRDQIDWGFTTNDVALLGALQAGINEDSGR